MIRIANWLLTRKCNLRCDYCAIVKDYENKPEKYPNMKHYIEKEMSTETVINGLTKLKLHNPDMFHIFYGGEPLLRKDLSEIIKFANKNDIHYTIISNNTPEIRPLIEKLFEKVGKINGFTASIDPIFSQEQNDHRTLKSVSGFKGLVKLKKFVNDVVGEITITNDTVSNIYELVKMLSEKGINSDITFVDIAKTEYYDFSNVRDEKELVNISSKLGNELQKLWYDPKLDIHMKDVLIPEIWTMLPSNYDCEIEKILHNISIDADGTVRLCLRIRGVYTPEEITIDNLIRNNGAINVEAIATIRRDKKEFCKLCNHTCQIMSKFIEKQQSNMEELVHLEKRRV
jgi:MoaA/NifB/PqqE/SkfB family radical SAM enzyme